MKAVIAIDSFKGCLTSEEAGQAASCAFPGGAVSVIPVSDGGEGFSDIITAGLDGEFRTVLCHNPLLRPIEARYGIVHGGRVAVIETAAASGIGLLRKEELNPEIASSYGTGELMLDALENGAREIWLGLGGSATCDGGIGLLRALGYRFLSDGREITAPNAILEDIDEIDCSGRNSHLDNCKIFGFYDVSVPFFGDGGAAKMFAPQKGASAQLVERLDSGMYGFAGLVRGDIGDCPGAGAAGGIGGALHSILGAEMRRGVTSVLDIFSMDKMLKDCDLVLTGEGKSDLQTLRGKVPSGVLEYVREHCGKSVKVVLLAGQVQFRDELLAAGFDAVLQVTPDDMPLSEALKPSIAKANIARAVADYLELN